jgi:hypothetical protein
MKAETKDALADRCFADLARCRGIVPNFRQAHGSGFIEVVDLLDATTRAGDCVLRLAAAARIEDGLKNEILERLLRCYSDPLTNAREIAQITLQVGKFEP